MLSDDRLTTDESLWPIVIHETVGVPPESDVIRMLARSDACLARREKYIVIFDSSRAGSTPGYLRDASIRWLKDNRGELERWCLGSALVVRSPALRFLMSTVLLMTSHTVPQEVFPTFDKAMDWAEAKLRAADVAYPNTRARRLGV